VLIVKPGGFDLVKPGGYASLGTIRCGGELPEFPLRQPGGMNV